MLLIILIVILVFVLIGSLPVYPWSPTNYGYYPSGGVGLLLLILVLLWALGYLHR
jgi:Protein of unknown function (DUF3309)